MKTLSIRIASLIFLGMQLTFIHAQDTVITGIRFRSLTLDQALATAKTENKPVFLHCYADWCHYCMNMRDSIFTNKEVGEFFNENFICIQLEMEKEGAELNKTLKITTFPSQVFYDTNGEIMHRGVGRRMRQAFIALGKEALNPLTQMRTYEQKFKSDSATNRDVYYYLKTFEYANSNQQQMVNYYLMKQRDTAFTNSFNWRVVYEFMKEPEYPMMDRVVKNKKDFEKKYTTDSVNNKIINMDVFYLGLFVRRLDSVGYETKKEKIRRTKGLDIAEKICALSDLNKYKLKSEWTNYKEAAKTTVEKFLKNDYQRINETTVVCLDHMPSPDDLKLYEAWLLQSKKLSDTYQANFLLARTYYRIGDKKRATDAANYAIERGANEKVNTQEVTTLLDDIQKLP